VRKPSPIVLKSVCLLFGGLLLYQVGRVVVAGNPLAKVTLPGVPSLPQAADGAVGRKATNGVPGMAAGGTNREASGSALVKTNSGAGGMAMGGEGEAAKGWTTNRVRPSETNSVVGENVASPGNNAFTGTNTISGKNTNSAARKEVAGSSDEKPAEAGITNNVRIPGGDKSAQTNLAAVEEVGSKGSNAVALTNVSSGKKRTNSAAVKEVAMAGMGAGVPGMPGMPGMGGPAPELPPVIKARVNRIVESEILGPVMRPMPMALVGIAGDVAFLRTASGQTGLAKEGEEVGGLKLLKIGINRVLVEENGEKKELTIFSGLGGESLMPKTEPSHEHTNH